MKFPYMAVPTKRPVPSLAGQSVRHRPVIAVLLGVMTYDFFFSSYEGVGLTQTILIGGISFVLIIIAPNMPTYEALTRRLFAENELVVSFRTLVALDRVKTGTAIVVP